MKAKRIQAQRDGLLAARSRAIARYNERIFRHEARAYALREARDKRLTEFEKVLGDLQAECTHTRDDGTTALRSVSGMGDFCDICDWTNY